MTPLQSIDARTDRLAPREQRSHEGHNIFIDTLEAARRLDYLKENTVAGRRRARNAFRMFARRHGLTLVGSARSLRVSWRDVEAELHRQQVRRHER